MLGSCLAVEESQAATLQPGLCSMSLTAAKGKKCGGNLGPGAFFLGLYGHN